ncbi:acyltransferase family protein [Pirellula sp. SH-Sr6A]|uniref:acyltransferase family protein n=1 Tax=Pirellula sp. SH-Sr6A TaxID=1632865 RepID=UPI00197B5DEF|nr:acyltransferase [Pirellula sp. SH-Sr6A]
MPGKPHTEKKEYRKDIDGLRAIAVLSVILFHFGWLPAGYLGVDIFFVISGYLITGIIHKETQENSFSIIKFYLRRVRRILPMCTFTVAFSLIIGFFVMLPDDLENLGQSAVATNLFSNNILQSITTGNYWDVTNEHKPLLHTWSLAVEEQYYLFIPILASLFFRTRKAFAVVLTVLSVFSLVLFYSPVPEHIRFYQLPCRFFEIAIGGIAKLCFGERSLSTHFLPIGIAALIAIVFSPVALPGPIVTIPLTVALAAFVLVAQPGNSKFARKVLENRISILVGLTSYSLYMWHQPLIAFYRYTVSPEINAISGIALLSLTLILSIASYHVIEKPFRSPNTIPTWLLFLVLIPAISSTTAFGYYLNSRGGIVRDVPELDIRITDATKGVHSRYNHKIRELNQGFTEVSQLERVLIVGNSFARDWANILLESSEAQSIEIQYVEHPMSDPTFLSKFQRADIVFFSTASRRDIANMGVSTEDPRIYVIGTKNFGTTAGIFYNYRGDNYISQTTEIDDEHWEVDAKLRSDWGSQFVDLLSEVKADGERVHVITPEGKLISQDCRHLTKAGATFFARRLESRIRSILHPKRESDSNNE